MLLILLSFPLDCYFTLNTYKALNKKKYAKAKMPYIILSLIYYIVVLFYVGLYYYLVNKGVSINALLLRFIKLVICVSFLFDMSLKLSIYSNIKYTIKSKNKASKK